MSFRSLSVAFILLFFFSSSVGFAQEAGLHVCADPDNLPFSDVHGRGFENRLAQMIGVYLQENIQFVWQRMGRGFVREYMDKGKCDLVVGIPAGFRPLLTTRPYYKSSFVFLTRKSSAFQPASLGDPSLKRYRIGVEALEEEYTPPAEALSRRGLQAQLVGVYSVGAHSFDLVKSVSRGDVDFAIMWGPTAGYAAKLSPNAFTVVPVQPDHDGPLPFTFAIAMGVKKGNLELQAKLNDFIESKQSDIQKVLEEYGIPQLSNAETRSQVGR